MLGKECEFGAIRVTVNVGVGTFGEISTLPIGGLSIPHSKSHQKDDVQSRKPWKKRPNLPQKHHFEGLNYVNFRECSSSRVYRV